MQILSDISHNLQEGRARDVQELVQQALDRNIPVKDILEKGLLDGMSIIGTKFKNNEVFVPEVLIAARAMNRGVELLKPYYSESGVESKGRVCIGTVQGDLHDIGKNLVKMMLEGKGFEVLDLGTDVPADSFIKTTVEKECQIICLSALLTTTMSAMAEVVKAAEQSGIRGQVKIMIGGAPVTDEFRIQIGADGYAPDAASAADLALELIKTL
ncbi:MAG: corrinoid protein [Christensenellales bacterium]|jgi:corrinoid protein of di/trimethylamine methyltransferase